MKLPPRLVPAKKILSAPTFHEHNHFGMPPNMASSPIFFNFMVIFGDRGGSL